MLNDVTPRSRLPLLAIAVGLFCVATVQAAFASGTGCTGSATTPNYPLGTWSVQCGGTCPPGNFCIPIAYPNGDPGHTMEGCYCDPTPGQPGSGDETSSIDVLCTFQLIRDPGTTPYALCLKELCAEPCLEWSGSSPPPAPAGSGEQKCICP